MLASAGGCELDAHAEPVRAHPADAVGEALRRECVATLPALPALAEGSRRGDASSPTLSNAGGVFSNSYRVSFD